MDNNKGLIYIIIFAALAFLSCLIYADYKISSLKKENEFLTTQLKYDSLKLESLENNITLSNKVLYSKDSLLTSFLKASQKNVEEIKKHYNEKNIKVVSYSDSVTISEFRKMLLSEHKKYGHLFDN